MRLKHFQRFATRCERRSPEASQTGDSLRLFLLVRPSGGKLWRLKYRINGREKKLGIGTYPEAGLAEARSGGARRDLRGAFRRSRTQASRRDCQADAGGESTVNARASRMTDRR